MQDSLFPCSRSFPWMRVALVVALSVTAACKTRTESGLKEGEAASGAPSPFAPVGSYPLWAYDGGPDLNTPQGRELVELNSRIPYFPGLSKAIYGDQMFRPAFGPIPWRMVQEPNTVQILFIGQDGTHIAEAAGRPATAGFGGRAQDLAEYFGVSSSAAFINTYAFTIRWQYGAFDTPIIDQRNGPERLQFSSFTGNPVWMITQDQRSPLVKWRNDMIEWIIRNNRDSLKLIVLFGGAARDAAGTFIESRGGTVASRFSADDIKNFKIKVPEFTLEGAGSNQQTAVPLNRQGKDLLKAEVGTVNYTDQNSVQQAHTKFKQKFDADPATMKAKMVIPGDDVGINGSGMMHPAQMGGYDIAKGIQIGAGEKGTLSIKGLKLSDGTEIKTDILVTQLPHPTALSSMSKEEASAAVKKGLLGFKKYVDDPENPWKIKPETDKNSSLRNLFAEGKEFSYGRGDMGTEYYDFGAPNSRMVNVSTAVRSGQNVIVFGDRDKSGFNSMGAILKTMQGAKAATLPQPPPYNDEMWIARATNGTDNRRFTFDPGPGEEVAKLMKTSLPQDLAFYKPRAVNGDFSHYRGAWPKALARRDAQLVDPDVVILADPDGEDDLITSRALTGTRGQFLHRLMLDLGVGDKYLLVKTAPYSSVNLWAETVEGTKGYREAVLKRLFAEAKPKLILTDGPDAAAELKRIFPECPVAGACVEIQRQGAANDSGIATAVPLIAAVPGFTDAKYTGNMADIPRSHLTYYARIWEGTSGDRVITSNLPQWNGKVFAEVAPGWATSQAYTMPGPDMDGCTAMMQAMIDAKVRLGYGDHSQEQGERIPSYITRLTNGTPVVAQERCQKMGNPPPETEASGSSAFGSQPLGWDDLNPKPEWYGVADPQDSEYLFDPRKAH